MPDHTVAAVNRVKSAEHPSEPYNEYDARIFVNRDSESAILRERIGQIQSARINKIHKPEISIKSLIEFYSVKGQGKSWLVGRLHDEFRFRRENSPGGEGPNGSLTALFNFRDIQESSSASIIQRLTRDLTEQSGQTSEVPYLDAARAPSPKELEKMTEKFVDLVMKLGRTWVPVLFFDTTEVANSKTLEWLEEYLVFPLIRSDRVIFVFAGRRRLFWRLLEVRRRADPFELEPLSEQASAEQLMRQEHDRQVANYLFCFSRGHPDINSHLLKGLQDLGVSRRDIQAVRAKQDYILNQVRDIVDTQFLGQLTPKTRMLVWNVFVLRKFHTAQLRHFDEWDQPERKPKAEGDYFDLIQEMMDQVLARWDSSKGGYVLDATVREVMLENLKERDRQRFIALQKRAVEMYESWIPEHPDLRDHYALEIIYHKGFLLDLHALNPTEFRNEIDGILPPASSNAFPEGGTELSNMIREDVDLEQGLFRSYPKLRDHILSRVPAKKEASLAAYE